MSANWVGPLRVFIELSNFSFRVVHFLKEEAADVQITRINPYSDSLVVCPIHMRNAADLSNRLWYTVIFGFL